ncbi:hypothetical protein DMR_36260 [Solidesulfovibrio magneticus RS-1]|uniref:Uncharacterized protein n=1 Tax=Solidesulfovibrio magneticus (strain ATCC 700980 / DSM 13731 / RS-1) TaxID=573370 RepID=C4XLH7_SOLM1|nr:hypothetical protein DMR_36260 [Solidesulfovibrio magneticus RS-1]
MHIAICRNLALAAGREGGDEQWALRGGALKSIVSHDGLLSKGWVLKITGLDFLIYHLWCDSWLILNF